MYRLSNDALAIVLGNLDLADVTNSRRVSKRFQNVADGDLTWSYLLRHRGIQGILPHPSRTWQDLARAINLHHVPDESSCLDKGATWLPFVRASQHGPGWAICEESKVLTETADWQAPPLLLNDHLGNATASIGIIPVDDCPETMIAIQGQLHEMMGLAPCMIEARVNTVTSAPATLGLDVFNFFPKYGASRVMAVLLRQNLDQLEGEARRICNLFQLMMSTCSTVIFAGQSQEAVTRWQRLVVPTLDEAAATATTTCEKVPNVLFMTRDGSGDVCDLLQNAPRAFLSWMVNRTNTIGHTSFSMQGAISLKTYQLPTWINALANVRVPVSTVLRMIVAGVHDTQWSSFWSLSTMAHVCSAEEASAFSFYKLAMDTEIEEYKRSGPSGSLMPLEAVDLVQMHDQFFYASLRRFSFSLGVACGDDTANGLQIPEGLKRLTSGYFRIQWRANIVHCREYCEDVFSKIIAPVYSEFFDGSAFGEKNSLRAWYVEMEAKIEEYQVKSRGMRRYDVLSELICGEVTSKMRAFCDAHPEHPYLHHDDAEAALVSLREIVNQLLQNATRTQDEQLSQMQRSSAMYTSSVGTQWVVQTLAEAASSVRTVRCDAELWDALRLMKRNTLIPPTEHDEPVELSSVLQQRQEDRLELIRQIRNAEHDARSRADRVSAQVDMKCKNTNSIVVRDNGAPSRSVRQTVLSWFGTV